MREFLQEYFQQPEMPWVFAAIVCAGLASVRIFCDCRKYINKNNSTSFPKYLWYIKFTYIREDGEYEGYMIKYLSYYSILVLIMSGLEYFIKGDVELLSRLDMWSIVVACIGLQINSGVIWFVKRIWGDSASMMTAYAAARVILYYWLSSIGFMIIFYFAITRWRELDIGDISITAVMTVLIVLCQVIVVFVRKYSMLHFKESIKNEYKPICCKTTV